MKIIRGYKAFNEDMTNRYGMKFEEGETYFVTGEAVFGVNGNGFHFCQNIEDTFRYFDPEKCKIAKVTGSGDIASYSDEYNGYYDMYSSTVIRIDRILKREEILKAVLDKGDISIRRFLQTGFSLTEDEISQFEVRIGKNKSTKAYLDFYARNDKDAFSLKKKL